MEEEFKKAAIQCSDCSCQKMFTGTAPEAGITGTCGFARKISGLPYMCTIFISHFKELAEMAQTDQTHFKNYHVVAHADSTGIFTPTYRIQEGISYQNDAFLRLHQAANNYL